MGEEMGAAFAAGSMTDAGGLGGSAQSTEIRLAGREVNTTNGPWPEAVEVAGGYSILEARSREEAVEGARRVIELHKEHWPGWEGSVEARPILGGPGSRWPTRRRPSPPQRTSRRSSTPLAVTHTRSGPRPAACCASRLRRGVAIDRLAVYEAPFIVDGTHTPNPD